MPRLKNIHKELIIKELATYATPADVIKRVKEEFDIEISYPQLALYNLDTTASVDLSKKWKELFRHIRNEFKDEVAKHQISKKAYRLGVMQIVLDRQLANKNDPLVLQVLEQSAKEMGGAYEGKNSELHSSGNTNYIQNIYKFLENGSI